MSLGRSDCGGWRVRLSKRLRYTAHDIKNSTLKHLLCRRRGACRNARRHNADNHPASKTPSVAASTARATIRPRTAALAPRYGRSVVACPPRHREISRPLYSAATLHYFAFLCCRSSAVSVRDFVGRPAFMFPTSSVERKNNSASSTLSA